MRIVKIAAILMVVLGMIGLWFSCRMENSTALPASIGNFPDASVVIVTLDTARADRFGAYGSTAGLTPFIDSLAEHGIVFANAQSVAPITLPSHASMMTGLYPIGHGVRNNGMFVLEDEIETLAEVFSEEGYATGAFISAQVLVRRYGLAQGFDVFDDDLSRGKKIGQGMVPSRRGNLTLEAAQEWMNTVPQDKPLFLWLHLYDPHFPYDPPPSFRSKFPSDPYGAEIAFCDFLVQNLVASLEESGRLSNTVFTVLSDHGEGLGEHGEQTHGFLLHQATIHVPWILTTPGTTSTIRVGKPVSTVDLAPLLTKLVGVRNPNKDRSDGRIPFDRNGEQPEERSLYYEAMLPMYQYGWAPLRGVQQGNWKLVSGARDELYDLATDPRELTDIVESEVLQRDYLNTSLHTIVETDTHFDSEVALEIPPSERDALQALGYIATTAPTRRNPPDPRDLVTGHVHVEQARSMMAAGLYDDALKDIDLMLADDPENITALNLKGEVLLTTGEFDRAEETFKRSLQIDSANSDVVTGLCRLEMRRKNYERVIELCYIGKETRSPFGVFDALEARALVALGRNEEAAAVIDKALKTRPDDADLLTAYANRLILEGKTAEAEAALSKAVAATPFHAGARSQLGRLLVESGRQEDAVEVFEDLLKIQPDDSKSLFEIGSILMNTDPPAALPYLEEACRLAPAKSEFLVSLGVTYIKVGRLPEAEASLRRAIELNPHDPNIMNNLGIVLTQEQRYKDAILEYEKLLNQVPGFYKARNNLAIALAQMGDLEAAEKEVRRALASQPNFLDAHLTLAAILEVLKRSDEERETLTSALKLAPDRIDLQIRLGIASAKAGQCDRALELFDPFLQDPVSISPELNFEAARCLEEKGLVNEALRHFEEAARRSAEGANRQEAQEAVRRLSLRLSAAKD